MGGGGGIKLEGSKPWRTEQEERGEVRQVVRGERAEERMMRWNTEEQGGEEMAWMIGERCLGEGQRT